MPYLRVLNPGRGTSLGDRIQLADRWWQRLRGLSGRAELAEGQGLLLRPCKAVHMYGMRLPLDVAFLDAAGCVVAVYPGLAPGRRTGWHRAAVEALELPSGTLERTGTRPGDTLACAMEEKIP